MSLRHFAVYDRLLMVLGYREKPYNIPTHAAARAGKRWNRIQMDYRRARDLNANAAAVLAFMAVFCVSWFGFLTREIGQLALLWPTNAVALGLIVRFPQMRTRRALIAFLLGYIVSDVSVGDDMVKTALLSLGNITGVVAGALVYRSASEEIKFFERPSSVLWLLGASSCASLSSGVVGAFIDPILFDGTALTGLEFWAATELANYLTFLPAILTLPWPFKRARTLFRTAELKPETTLPIASFAVAMLVAAVVGGPLSAVFALPPLLWCALTYSVFSVSMLTLVYGSWLLLGESFAALVGNGDRNVLLSMRVGVSLIMLGPLAVATVMSGQLRRLHDTRRLAEIDPLCGVLNRRAFYEAAASALNRLEGVGAPATILMLDVDRFKSINDTHGHSVGDDVLVEFARQITANVRAFDLVARFGGEEFCVFLPNTNILEAGLVAERIRASTQASTIKTSDERRISYTVSIGGACSQESSYTLERLLRDADANLYHAKNRGRNRVEMPCLKQAGTI